MKKLSVGFIFLTVINFAFLQIRCSAQEGSLSRVKVTKYSGPSDPSPSLPIKPTRTISFTTEEGTNMNVDISPDGHTLLFDLLGDLYTIPITGGNATQLTRGLAINLRAVWSPNGKSIAYISDYSGSLHLNVRDISGKYHWVLGKMDKQLNYLYYISPLWTSDGNYVALDGKIYGLTGGEVLPREGINNPIQFSPSGQFIYYQDSEKLYQYDCLNKEKSAISTVLRRCRSYALSPDAHWWAYITDSNSKSCLILKNLETENERMLVPSLYLNNPACKAPILLHFAFSPDSKQIFIAYGGKIHKIDVGSGNDSIVHFTAHVKIDAGPLNYNKFRVPFDSVKVRYMRSATASPDGKHLVLCALDRLYTMNLPSGKPHLLIDQPFGQFQPIYSPNGKWIAYVSWSDTSGGYLWRVPAVGGKPEKLTVVPGQYQRPAWSPGGKEIAVIVATPELGQENMPQIGQLKIIPIDGETSRNIDDTVMLWNELSFSHDGTRIIYEPNTPHSSENLIPLLVSKNVDGTNPQVLAVGHISGFNSSNFIQQRLVSPDGRFIVYSMGEDLYLVPVSSLTGPAILYDDARTFSAIRFAAGVDPQWEKTGKILSWNYGNKYYRIDPNKILLAAQQRKMQGLVDSAIITVPVEPDQVIKIDISVPVLHGNGILALKNLRIITMNKSKVIEDGTIIIKDGRFIAVGPSSLVPIPKGAKLLDLRGTTALPGFVDVHLHTTPPPDVFPQQYWSFLANLAYGVTTERDPAFSFDSFGYEELLESGQMIGPRLYTVGRPVLLGLQGIARVDNIADARAIVQKRATLGATYIKQYSLPTRLQRQWLLIASREAGLNLTNEGDNIPTFQLAMMKDGSTGVEHNPDWNDIYDDVTRFIAMTGTYLTPTLQVRFGDRLMRVNSNYQYWHQPDAKLRNFTPKEIQQSLESTHAADTTNSGYLYPSQIDARICKQGGKIALGSHGNNEGIGVHNELWALQMGGLSNMQALQAATITGAQALGLQNDIGTIEVGKIADLLILNKDPLQDIHNSREIRYVMKGGILYDGNTLDELWPSQTKCPEWKPKP